MSRLEVSLFGTFQVKLADVPIANFRSVNTQGLLAYLILQGERPFSRDTLATLFWPDVPDSTAKKNLRQTLYQLRQLLNDSDELPSPFLLVSRQNIQWNPESDYSLDVQLLATDEKEGHHYLVMELVEGGDLLGFLQDNPHPSLNDVLSIALDLGDALARAHRLNILHRDIKPANVLLAQMLDKDKNQRLASVRQVGAVLEALLHDKPIEPALAPSQPALYASLVPAATPPTSHRTTAVPQVEEREAQLVLLNKVQQFWVEGVLRQTVNEGTLIEIGLETMPDAVANPWEGIVWCLCRHHRCLNCGPGLWRF